MNTQLQRNALAARAGAIAVAVGVALALGACAPVSSETSRSVAATKAESAATTPVTPVAPTLSAERIAKRDANTLGTALQLQMQGDISFGTEPEDDVWPRGTPVRLYVHISKVTTSPATLTYDAWQVFTGAAAKRESARDRQPAPKNGFYERNAYQHSQTVDVAEFTGVVLQIPGATEPRYGFQNYPLLTATTWADFARQYTTGDRSGELR